MTKRLPRGFVSGLLLVAFCSLAGLGARAQAVTDTVVTVSYLSLKPEQANAWLGLFKKHIQPALTELQNDGALLGWHLFVPGLHHAGAPWTHALALASKDRAAQGVVEKKVQAALAAMPAGDAKLFFGAVDREKHSDDEWREVNFDAVVLPEEKGEEKPEGK